jgi:hypothetical protein
MVKKSKVTRKSKRAPEMTSSVELAQWAAQRIEKGKRDRMSPAQVAAQLMADLEDLASANAMSRDR